MVFVLARRLSWLMDCRLSTIFNRYGTQSNIAYSGRAIRVRRTRICPRATSLCANCTYDPSRTANFAQHQRLLTRPVPARNSGPSRELAPRTRPCSKHCASLSKVFCARIPIGHSAHFSAQRKFLSPGCPPRQEINSPTGTARRSTKHGLECRNPVSKFPGNWNRSHDRFPPDRVTKFASYPIGGMPKWRSFRSPLAACQIRCNSPPTVRCFSRPSYCASHC